MHGNIWRLKYLDTSNPNTFSYSSRFSIQDHPYTYKRSSFSKDKAKSKYIDLMQDLDHDEIEQARVSRKLEGMRQYLDSMKTFTKVPASLKYSQVTVCRQCYFSIIG